MQTIGFIFPGQGSHSIGMLADIAEEFTEVKQVFSEASDILHYDLWELTQIGPAEKLDQTEYTQPALLAASYALWKIIQKETAIHPDVLAGHSLGEYTALVAAGAFSFSDAIQLVAARGRFMQAAQPLGKGALAVMLGLEDAAVVSLCEEASGGDVLAPANFNSPGQIVVAGDYAAVLRAIQLAKDKGAKLARLLPVSVPSHCILMKPAADQLAVMLKGLSIHSPHLSVINNVDVSVYQDADTIREGLTRQLYRPVLWSDIIKTFSKQGITLLIECGPGKVLTGLTKRIDPSIRSMSTSDLISLQALLAELRGS